MRRRRCAVRKGLCFNYFDEFVSGYKSKGLQFLCIIAEEDDDCALEISFPDQLPVVEFPVPSLVVVSPEVLAISFPVYAGQMVPIAL
ncbi:hypothetical protein Syun_004173 [Stephania yunnanensis]|uniref:Uncharacterized protein n=1 Tax=Stephania yunnanensis TaxID=152371 RepID=A0AAP0Q4N5_9MAGN